MKKKIPSKKTIKKKNLKFIVGIGSSAGGLEALEHFFKNISAKSGASFVVVSHLDPKRDSYLIELISNYTSMSVGEVKEGESLQPNFVYVIPPNKTMIVKDGVFHLNSKEKSKSTNHSIDTFFISMAKDFKSRCVGIILSGSGTDGAQGMLEITKQNGLTVVQTPESSKFDAMPLAAIKNGNIEHILDVDEIPKAISSYYKYLQSGPIFDEESNNDKHLLSQVYSIIKDVTAVDFTEYKRNSIIRQIHRHMNKNNFKNEADYIKFLSKSKLETRVIANSILIGVTKFFRDPGSFLYLSKYVIPQIFESKKEKEVLRIWVCACSTGEEAYSIAILFKEQNEKNKTSKNVKIFATDINAESISFARKGRYPLAINKDISQKRLEKYFVKKDNSYQIKNEIREMMIFATHDITVNPTFSNMDLTCCRNLLIYLNSKLQNKTMALLTYSLDKGSFLFLGHSESIGESSKCFKTLSQKHKIFQMNIEKSDQFALIEPHIAQKIRMAQSYDGKILSNQTIHLREIVSSLILKSFAPCGVVINKENNIIYYHGKTSEYLEADTGKVDMNIFNLLREDLRFDVGLALDNSRKESKVIHSEDINLEINKHSRIIKLIVAPLVEPVDIQSNQEFTLQLILFKKLPNNIIINKVATKSSDKRQDSAKYKKEIEAMKLFFENKVKNLEVAQEDFLLQIDKLQTTNEELQSSNEELETSGEELQAIYEEFYKILSQSRMKN
jgi:two-component system CheB/CheR fusion protein